MSALHSGAKSGGALERLDALLDWSPIAERLGRLHASAKGEAAWPPLAMFKALLLSVWYDLSDVKLAEALDDRASFRRFCGFSSNEPTPEHTAFVRFRRAPVMAELDHILFETITAQLKARSVTVKTGTIVDATIIASAREGDVDGRWVKHKNKPAVHGFKAHVGADADTALVEEIDITPANGNDGRAGPDTLPPGARRCLRRQRLSRSPLRPGHSRKRRSTTHHRHSDVGPRRNRNTGAGTLARLSAFNAAIQRVRARIEKIFGTWKRSYGLRRMRWRGLAKASAQVRLTAIAYNLKRSLSISRQIA